jgi:hypothetical protein
MVMKFVHVGLIPRQVRGLVVASACFVAFSLAAVAFACNVPVFRFALERWRPDAYRITVLHRGPLSESEREFLRPLEDLRNKTLANLDFRAVDLLEVEKKPADGTHAVPPLSTEFGSRVKEGASWLIVQYPEYLRIEVPVWNGPLSRETIERLVDSPVRKELVRRLVEGQTAVWLLLESGDKDRDDAVADLLAEEIPGLEQNLKLPELTSDPDDELLAKTPFKVAFSAIRVPRDAELELALAGMLIRCEPDLADRSDPMIYPVFGRGRAMLPLIGAGITAKNIQDSAEFLVGPCSCQVKELNPGFDLLLSADWNDLLSQDGQQLTAIQSRHIRPASGETELVPIPTGSRETVVEAKPAVTQSSWLVSSGIFLGVAAFVVLLSAMHAGKS